jgi:hypothetical protein
MMRMKIGGVLVMDDPGRIGPVVKASGAALMVIASIAYSLRG